MQKLIIIALHGIYFIGIPQLSVSSVTYNPGETNVITYGNRLEVHYGCCLTESKCGDLCNYHPNCVSFFYNSDKDQCQLHSSLSNITDMQSSLGWNYYILFKEDCEHYLSVGRKTDGVYTMNTNGKLYDVWCDLTNDGGGWTVFQKRFDGSVDFYRGWNDYALGFGNLSAEFWLGNEILHWLTSKHTYKLRINMEDYEGVWKYAEYSTFSISTNDTGYVLNIGNYSGTAGNSLEYHNGFKFSTKDSDDNYCAKTYFGGWWYHECHRVNLNGVYGNTTFGAGLNWYAWHENLYSLRKTIIKIKRV